MTGTATAREAAETETGLTPARRDGLAAAAALRANVRRTTTEAAERASRLRRRAGLLMRRAGKLLDEAREADGMAKALGRWLATDDAVQRGGGR